ncbi:MAG: hypothetical protein HY202_08445 [Nitrospirae bacterium]|jgi:hypothetical protein|nr:hypothetical protein [Nitrospirota bacterium]
MRRREYDIQITVNGRKIRKVIIDPHYETKHSGSLDDQIILGLVNQLNGQRFEPVDEDFPYLYFVTDGMVMNAKKYKLVWLMEADKLYIGVVNAYRR